jgi:methionine aminopeptidase
VNSKLMIDGVHGDTSIMCLVGDVHEDIKKLIDVT